MGGKFIETENEGENSLDSREEPDNSAIRQLLSSYEIGAKLRTLRLKKKMALIDLGKLTGLSASMLSQLENGKLIPTLPTLVRISSVFDVSLDHFFGNQKQKKTITIIRSNDRSQSQPIPQIRDHWTDYLLFTPRDRSLQAYLLEFSGSEDTEVPGRIHEGGELVHIVEGSISITYNNETHELQSGDSIHFDSSEKHSFRRLGSTQARALVVTTPPRT